MDFFKENSIIPSMENGGQQFYSENALIQPPVTKHEEFARKSFRYIIDSKDRSKTDSLSSYTIYLNEDVQEVISVELIYQDFQFNEYNVTKFSNLMYVDGDKISVEPGVYDALTLRDELNSVLETYGLSLSYSDIKRKFKITNSTGFEKKFNVMDYHAEYNNISSINTNLSGKRSELRNLSTSDVGYMELYDDIVHLEKTLNEIRSYRDNYKKNSIYSKLGFGREDLVVAANGEIELDYPINLTTDRYIVMYLQQAKNYNSANNIVHQCFAIINDNKGQTYDQHIKKGFNPPIPSYKKLNFKFCDSYGNPYDFQNKDHRFELVITCLKQTRMYGKIFS